MAPIFRLFNYIIAKFFNGSVEYDRIEELNLPSWFYVLVALFVGAIAVLIFLAAHGLKFFIYRHYICQSECWKLKKERFVAFPPYTRISTTQTDNESDESQLSAHIFTRKSTRNSQDSFILSG